MTADQEYVAGDINTVPSAPADVNAADDDFDGNELVLDDDDDDDDGVDDMVGNRAEDSTPTAVLIYVAKALADEPDAVVVQVDRRQGTVRLRLHVAPDDMGRVIGRRGRTAQAIRTLVGVAGAQDGIQTSVDIVDD